RILAHEFGHAVMFLAFDDVSYNTGTRSMAGTNFRDDWIRAAHNAWSSSTGGQTGRFVSDRDDRCLTPFAGEPPCSGSNPNYASGTYAPAGTQVRLYGAEHIAHMIGAIAHGHTESYLMNGQGAEPVKG
ncbi:MAG: hypothetical protein ACK5PP_13915, partial [Acidimicrobiales bacterium]